MHFSNEMLDHLFGHVEVREEPGGAAHPGPGMPMVLMSGWIAADALDQDKVASKAGFTTTPAASASRGAASSRTSSARRPGWH